MCRRIIDWSLSIDFFELVWFNFKLKHSPGELDTYGSIVGQYKILLQFDQCSKFGLSIRNIEITVFQYNLSMFSRDWDVSYSDLTLMSSSNFDGNILLSRNEVKASLLFILLLVVYAL